MAGIEFTKEVLELMSKRLGYISFIHREGYVETRIEVDDLIQAYLALKKEIEAKDDNR